MNRHQRRSLNAPSTYQAPSISQLIQAQKRYVPSPESIEFVKTQVQQKISLEDLEKWMHESFEKAERDKDYRVMAMYSKTNDLLSNIILQYTMDKYPGKIVWVDPQTGKQVT